MIRIFGARYTRSPLEAMLGLSRAEIFDELVGPDEVHAMALLDRAQPERDGEMGLADAGRPEKQDIGRFVDERQRGEART